jgi:hydrogenase expression/formation protein HypD
MKFTAQQWLQRIHALPLGPNKIKILNVCGGHERAISLAGLRAVLPPQVELIPGPGCPVCVCPEEDIYLAIQLALHPGVMVVAFGDMLRVPASVPKKQLNSLAAAKAAGGSVTAIASPLEILPLAKLYPQQQIVFFVAGFETTTAPVAALLAQGLPSNVYLLLSGRLTAPIIAWLLYNQKPYFDALIAPGHVAAIMGAEQWRFCVTDYQLPTAVAGFDNISILAAIYSLLRQKLEQHIFLDNCYPQVVTAAGNPTAQSYLAQTMQVENANWRGVGEIAASGFALRNSQYDIKQHYPDYISQQRPAMPPGCDCAAVVLGQIYPSQCRLYGLACKPEHPIGPCMVSDEGACHIWWHSSNK